MDPVALLNEIPDLIERCVRGYNFCKDVKGAPKACLELMKELDNARSALAELQAHVSRMEDKRKAYPSSASLQNYKTSLDKLDCILKKYRDPTFRFTFKTRVKWVLSDEKKIKELCDDLKQNSGNFQPLLIQIARDIDEMNVRQQEAHATKAAKKLAKRLREVVKWLEPLNSQAKLREVRRRCQLGTCDWLPSHDRFISWCESTASFLWLNGILGNGKTIIVSSVIDYLETNLKCARENIILFAFADFQDTRSTDLAILLCTLLVQLLDKCEPEDIVEDLDFVELEKNMERHHSDRPKFVQYLVELLGKASAPWKRVFIVIDALDECVQKNRRESIAAIRSLVSAGSKFSILVTSRAEQDIIDVLRSISTISLIDETQRVKDNIARFIEVKMNMSYLPLKHLPELVRAHISSTLLEKANGMFRLVDCQLQSLANAKLEKDIDMILKNLPADLNSMYERILESVQGKGLEAAQILRLEEVMEAVMVEAGRDSPNLDLKLLSGEHLLEMCSSLVCHDVETDIVTLSHASVQEFLFFNYLRGTAHSDYYIPSFPSLHRHNTGLISTYLQYKDLQDGPCTTLQNLAKCLEQHPFLVYVVSNWHLHIIKMYEICSEAGEQHPDIDTLFALSDDSEKSILTWCSCRQISYFGTELRCVMKDGSSKLQWNRHQSRMVHKDLLNVTKSKDKSLQDVRGFVLPHRYAGPYWLKTNYRHFYPGQDLTNTTSVEEPDYMVYPLISKGPASLVWDLLHKLPQFKNRPLFYFGTPLVISIFACKLDIVKMLLQDPQVYVNTRALHYDCNYQVVSPIFIAIKYGHVEAFELLLQHGSATVFLPDPLLKSLSDPDQGPEDGHNEVIIGAAAYGHVDILQTLIHHGINMNTRFSISSNTALHAAVSFEDLKWAVEEPWYSETQQYLVPPRGDGPKSQQDIEEIAHLLGKQLSLPLSHTIIRAILDFSKLTPRKPYLSTLPISGSQKSPVWCIVFKILSAEEWKFKEYDRGLYDHSTTWFEAGVESIPGMFMRIQDNVSADDQSQTHVNVWNYQDSPSFIKEWMSKITAEDEISVYARARGTVTNHVESVKITVYTSCV
ncbi:hypothetical protein EDD18DRAFT_1334626 [Armillaria luteobubalina]|uniref:Nephrocystin 3-like N-terminal domain-containing protein n=1 Tax=Armillaria luteobubalina TaxID=153913 RepID=A0AA39PWD3_9AGAR|nr:hypothetical protein EDD18DRAFT_1334626 [Armillaria luteobubalina]